MSLHAWTKVKPSEPGIYEIRGFVIGQPQSSAIVIVDLNASGEYVCNLHESTSESDREEWSYVDDFSDNFEWSFISSRVPFPEYTDSDGI